MTSCLIPQEEEEMTCVQKKKKKEMTLEAWPDGWAAWAWPKREHVRCWNVHTKPSSDCDVNHQPTIHFGGIEFFKSFFFPLPVPPLSICSEYQSAR